jgi:hypothetical protein
MGSAVIAIHLGRLSPDASCDQPGQLAWKRDWRVSPPRCPYSVLLPVGFTVPSLLPRTRCALTAPFHPCPSPPSPVAKGGLFSVALSLGSPPPEVIRHRISMEPGLSSQRADKPAQAERPSGLLTALIRDLSAAASSVTQIHWIGQARSARRWRAGSCGWHPLLPAPIALLTVTT